MKLKSLIVLSSLALVGSASANEVLDGILQEHAQKCLNQPSCPPPPAVQDAFNPQSCATPKLTNATGARYFLPGEAQVCLGNVHYQAQVRKCNRHTGCAGWTPISTDDLIYANQDGRMPLSPHGTAYMLTRQDGIRFRIDGAPTGASPWMTYLLTYDFTRMSSTSSIYPIDWMKATSAPANTSGAQDLKLKVSANAFTFGFSQSNAKVADVREGCARFVFETSYTIPGDTTASLEYQLGVLARY